MKYNLEWKLLGISRGIFSISLIFLSYSNPAICAEIVNGVAQGQSNIQASKDSFRRPKSIPFPANLPYSPEAELLGRTLFFDARLSGSGSLWCASCHNPSFGWEDGLALGHGEGMKQLGRHTPTILNVAWGDKFFWDGRAASLQAQATAPIGNPKEMNQNLAQLPAKLSKISGYRAMFESAYPGQGITLETIAKALAVFERTVASHPSPFDAWVDGDESAISDAAKRGFVLFTGRADCSGCHGGWRFTDDKFHDIGLPDGDLGRALIAPGEAGASHGFKTPTLRNITKRAPYMHDGSLPDLEAVLSHYVSGGTDRGSKDRRVHVLALTSDDVADLRAFLVSLSEPDESFPTPVLPQ